MSCCKTGTLIEEYDIESGSSHDDVNEYLIQRWIGHGEYTPTGLRPLKDWLNKQALKTVYTDNNRDTFDARVDFEYESITGEEADVSVMEDLSVDGIDSEKLRSNLISTATLYRHLTNCLGVNKSEEAEASTVGWERNKLEYAMTVVEQSAEESLRSLDNKERIPGASQATITTEVVLGCPECNTQVGFERALARGYICKDHLGRTEKTNAG